VGPAIAAWFDTLRYGDSVDRKLSTHLRWFRSGL